MKKNTWCMFIFIAGNVSTEKTFYHERLAERRTSERNAERLNGTPNVVPYGPDPGDMT